MQGDRPSLSAYAVARDRAFLALVANLAADDRFSGAWLSGAHGRGEDDEWSDFDLHLAVHDDVLEELVAEPRPLFELAGEVLLVQANFPSDSMPDGRFWLVMYPGPVHIDWNIGPASAAVRPLNSTLLFERIPIPVAAEPSALATGEVRDVAQKALEFFWAMAPIAVKYAGRGWTRRAVQQEALLAAAFDRLWRTTHHRPLRSQDAYDQNRPPDVAMLAAMPTLDATIDASAVLRAVSTYCDVVESLHPALAALGAAVPERMPSEVRALMGVARSSVASGATRPGSGRFR